MKQHAWLDHKKCSKGNRGEVWYTSYNRRRRSTVEKTSLMGHVYLKWGGT